MAFFQQLKFFTTVNDLRTLPYSAGEIAFIGRSNAGKSSAINVLARQVRLAYVSKTPGRTQHINFFSFAEAHEVDHAHASQYLVDLPGYGYAEVPDDIRQHWEGLLSRYLQRRDPLRGLVLIMDSRHPFKPLDVQMLDWVAPTGKPVHILLTKCDKLNNQECTTTLRQAKNKLINYPNASVQLFSSLKKTGLDELESVLNSWLKPISNQDLGETDHQTD